jgi:hypothetical protein
MIVEKGLGVSYLGIIGGCSADRDGSGLGRRRSRKLMPEAGIRLGC